MRGELDADADADDEVNERDGVERDAHERHGADDGGYGHGDDESDDESGGEGTEEGRGDD